MHTQKTNILIIMPDQFRLDCLGHSGYLRAKTPHLDKLAERGMSFDHAFCPIALCCPTRQSLLCGKRPEQHGGLWNYDQGIPVRLFTETTWTEQLPDAGYRTGYFGKWHVHPDKTPRDFGFEEFVSRHDYARWRQENVKAPTNTQSPYTLNGVGWFGGTDEATLAQTRTHWTADHAIDFIEQRAEDDAPWHVRLDPCEPHLPCYPHADFLELYDREAIEPPPNFEDTLEGKPIAQKRNREAWDLDGVTWEDWSWYAWHYLAMVSQVDDAIGRVLDALERTGQAENTIVIFTSDHGDAGGSHGLIDKHCFLYDEVTRVPLVIRWPEVVAPGTRNDNFIMNSLDLAATCAEVAGLPPLKNSVGRSLLPLLKEEHKPGWRDCAVSTYNGQQFGLYTMRMIRDRKWKYIWNPTDIDELYDLETDPHEMRNLAEDPAFAQTVREQRVRMRRILIDEGDQLAENFFSDHVLGK